MRTLFLCGAGCPEGVRLALSIQREKSRWDRIVLLDDDSARHGTSVLGVEVRGPFEMLGDADPESSEVCNLVARTTSRRQAARRKIESYGVPFASLVHPSVDLLGVELGNDITVYQNATLGAQSLIGEGSVIFIGAIVGHGSTVGPGCIVAPNAVLNARVELGEKVYVGTNSTVLPEVKVGAWATIGAGSVAVQNVPAGATIMGVPAEILMTGEQKLAAACVARRSREVRSTG